MYDLTDKQGDRREKMKEKLHKRSKGFSAISLHVQDGVNMSGRAEESRWNDASGEAILSLNGKSYIYDTQDLSKNFFVAVLTKNYHQFLIDIDEESGQYFLDSGFKEENSTNFVFAMYLKMECTEFLCLLDGTTEKGNSCIQIFTGSVNKRLMYPLYKKIKQGIIAEQKQGYQGGMENEPF